MRYSQKNIDQYLQMYPDLQRWVNQCPLCGARGRMPQMPDCVGSNWEVTGKIAAKTLRQMLPELELDEDGFCLTCSRLYRR